MYISVSKPHGPPPPVNPPKYDPSYVYHVFLSFAVFASDFHRLGKKNEKKNITHSCDLIF